MLCRDTVSPDHTPDSSVSRCVCPDDRRLLSRFSWIVWIVLIFLILLLLLGRGAGLVGHARAGQMLHMAMEERESRIIRYEVDLGALMARNVDHLLEHAGQR